MKKLLGIILLFIVFSMYGLADNGLPLLACSFDDTTVCAYGKTPLIEKTISYEEGKMNKGVLIDDSDELAYQSLNNINKERGTVEFWYKRTGTGSGRTGSGADGKESVSGLLEDSTRGDCGRFILRWHQKTETIKFYPNSLDEKSLFIESRTKINLNQWYHVVVTWDSVEGTQIFINGNLEAAHNGKYDADNFNNHLRIGQSCEATSLKRANGIIDELKIYGYVRTPSQIKKDALVSASCLDSDDGFDYNIKGSCTDRIRTVEDRCFGSKLDEQVCTSNLCETKEYVCLYGCTNGICINEPAESVEEKCSDTDNGVDYNFKGVCFDNTGNFKDVCVDDNTLKEFKCSLNECEFDLFYCPGGCKDNVCLESKEEPKEIEEDKCGDGVCDDSENEMTCPKDCFEEVKFEELSLFKRIINFIKSLFG